MRREEFRISRQDALDILHSVQEVHLSAVGPNGKPLVRVLHGIVYDEYIAFHSAPKGEKTSIVGLDAVVSATEVFALLPSYFFDPKRACPATTLYRSVQVSGVIEQVEDLERKSAILQALMERYQPEGGYQPIQAEDRMYKAVVKNILIFQVPLKDVVGKAKMGQNFSTARWTSTIRGLWERGSQKDLRSIELLRQIRPNCEVPDFLHLKAPLQLVCSVDLNLDLEEVFAFLSTMYWNQHATPEAIREAFVHSDAVVGVRCLETQRWVGICRAVSDHSKYATIYDVCVLPEWRGQGIGTQMLSLLLKHPAVRDVLSIHLSTHDAQSFYARLGFTESTQASLHTLPITHMSKLNSAVLNTSSDVDVSI